MKKTIITCYFILCCILANAQWQKTSSPNSGGVNCFSNTSTYIYAGTDSAGAFASMDNGDSWAIVASGLTNKSVKSLTTKGNNIFAGTYGNGVFLSTDQGSSWTAVNTGLTNSNINVLTTSGSNLFAGTNAGVFVSSDNGSNWSAINSGLTVTFVETIATNGTDIFAGTFGGGVFLSSDNGKSWKPVNNGLSSDSVSALAINGSNIYAGTNSSGVFISTDNGSSWNALSSGLTNSHVWALVPSGTHLFAATGGGGKKGSGTGGGNGQGKGKGGVFEFNPGYSAWTPQNTGLPKTDVRSLYIAGGNMFAGTADSNVWKRPLAELISGIPDLKKDYSGLKMYPNPASNSLTIEYSSISKTELVIFNMLGEIVFRDTWLPMQTGQHIIDVSGWKKGVYSLRIGNEVEKLIKD
jgi:hypothetical protein